MITSISANNVAKTKFHPSSKPVVQNKYVNYGNNQGYLKPDLRFGACKLKIEDYDQAYEQLFKNLNRLKLVDAFYGDNSFTCRFEDPNTREGFELSANFAASSVKELRYQYKISTPYASGEAWFNKPVKKFGVVFSFAKDQIAEAFALPKPLVYKDLIHRIHEQLQAQALGVYDFDFSYSLYPTDETNSIKHIRIDKGQVAKGQVVINLKPGLPGTSLEHFTFRPSTQEDNEMVAPLLDTVARLAR